MSDEARDDDERAELSARERFERLHRCNPHVLEQLRTRALRAKRRGFRPGIGCLFEVLRYSHGLATEGDRFKLNNTYRAYYARELERRCPELRGFFHKRRSAADDSQGAP